MSEGEEQLRDLMISYQGGSLEAFQDIYAQLAAAVRRYLFHLADGSEIADDLLQETFLQMHLGLGKECPFPWKALSIGKIIAIPQLGGLHHCYERHAA